ncbi:hypothetical protein EBQ81_04035 [bacterium]|nr:hypothetical protein [bacterium]
MYRVAEYNKNMKTSKKNSSRKKLIVLITFLAIGPAITGLYILKINDKNTKTSETTAKTTSTVPSAQENFTSNSDRAAAPTPTDKGSGGIADTQGQDATPSDNSDWTVSESGEITVYKPQKNSLLTKGAVLSGESRLSVVNYRLIDDISGMISQGQLGVVNGKFSGTISFNTNATGGRLDVYGATDSGNEFSNVEIPIRFK